MQDKNFNLSSKVVLPPYFDSIYELCFLKTAQGYLGEFITA